MEISWEFGPWGKGRYSKLVADYYPAIVGHVKFLLFVDVCG